LTFVSYGIGSVHDAGVRRSKQPLWDPAEYLETEEQIAAYPEDMFKGGIRFAARTGISARKIEQGMKGLLCHPGGQID
jgi:hypothetical protein